MGFGGFERFGGFRIWFTASTHGEARGLGGFAIERCRRELLGHLVALYPAVFVFYGGIIENLSNVYRTSIENPKNMYRN